MDAIYAHARVDNLDLDARSQWVGKYKNQRWMLSVTKQAISITLATTVGHILHGLGFANVYMAWPTWCWCSVAHSGRVIIAPLLGRQRLADTPHDDQTAATDQPTGIFYLSTHLSFTTQDKVYRCFIFIFCNLLIPSGKFGPPHLGKAAVSARAALPSPTSACWVFSYFRNPPNSDMDNRILTCVRGHSCACVYTQELGTLTASRHNILTRKKSQVFLVLLTGFEPRVIEWALPTEPPLHPLVDRG